MAESRFWVVINHELQVSLWPDSRPLPIGWAPLGDEGSRQECLQRIEALWTDMRPLSARIGPQAEPVPEPEGALVEGFVVSDAGGWCFGCPGQSRPLAADSLASGGLMFSGWREDALANAVAAAAGDPRYQSEFFRYFLAPSLLRDGLRLFQARGRVRSRCHSQLWADNLEIGPELAVSASPLWDLWLAFTRDQSPEPVHPGL